MSWAAFSQWFGEIVDFVSHIYDGLPIWALPIFLVAVVLVAISTISLFILGVRAGSQLRRAARADASGADLAGEHDYLWVFLVPALNEETVIADSVGRLTEVQVTHKRILVINDGSDDGTGEVLARISEPDLTVLTRVAPNARQGKSEALNDAWRYLHRVVLGEGRYRGWDPARVIVTIVDADGRLDRMAGRAARFFDDERVGGVQSQVRIYNRGGLVTVAQDLEFGVFGTVFQLGRTGWGTANMGGNGQFNRLAALDDIAVEDAEGRIGPWRAGRLTEDQDIGLRLIQAGWRGAQSSKVIIEQQGLHSLRALYRQRTRWAQGGWQVLDLLGPTARNRHVGFGPKLDQLWYLLTPVVQAWVGLSVVLSIVFLTTGISRPPMTVFIVVLAYVFSAMPGVIGVLLSRRRRGVGEFFIGLLLAHLYLIYSWLIYPVVYRSLLRQLTGSKSWAKTKREAIAPAEAGPASASA
ncbi:glycosyltransferase family 2 protein [Microbacterium sp.]|uniref:glycosyltransferase family 2 protein n=1 Tax=Microbacterium sp. TaxID=51671 RepID=UPI0028AE94F6|nr:glycosyltransferase family 2 protein [Microbacterium sp.]